jgi:hypothetical protein
VDISTRWPSQGGFSDVLKSDGGRWKIILMSQTGPYLPGICQFPFNNKSFGEAAIASPVREVSKR